MGQLCSEAIVIYLRRLLALFVGSDGEAEALEPLWAAVASDLARPWSLTELARRAEVSPQRLSRMVGRIHGHAPLAHLRALRLERARALMLLGDRLLDDIAAQVGYGSAFALSKAYKRRFGHAPRAR